MSETVVVICGPVWTAAVVPGSKLYKCTICGSVCACGPIGQKVVNEEGGLPHCASCGLKRYEAVGPNAQVHKASEASFELAKTNWEEYLKIQKNQ